MLLFDYYGVGNKSIIVDCQSPLQICSCFLYCHQLIADYICKLQLKLSMAYLPKIDHG